MPNGIPFYHCKMGLYLFTINSTPSHYQKVLKTVGHKNVTDAKAENVLPSEQNMSLLYSVSQVNFYIFLDLKTQVYYKYLDQKHHLLQGAFYIISHNSIEIQFKEKLRSEIFILFKPYIKIQHNFA